MPKPLDLTNKKFNKLTAIRRVENIISPSGKTVELVWECICECGTIKNIRTSSLMQNKTKSCGCLRNKSRKLPGEATRNALYGSYKIQAKYRQYKFEINKEQFCNLINDNCYYCGTPPKQSIFNNTRNYSKEWKKQSIISKNGIDRIDSNLGYTIENLVTCCKNCNIAKMSLTQCDFFEMIKLIYERHKLNEK